MSYKQHHQEPVPPAYSQSPAEPTIGARPPHACTAYEQKKWNTSLFDCFSPGNICLLTCCFPYVTYGRTAARIRDPTLSQYSCCNMDCMLFFGFELALSNWILQTIRRGEIRERFGIEGSCCGDCVTTFCCSCCAIIQEEKEVKLRTEATNSGYQMTAQMAYP